MEPETTVIVAVPVPALVARPAALTIATAAGDERHCTVEVRFCVVPSAKVPVAPNCCVVPSGIDGFSGLIAIDTSAAGVTVSTAEALTVPTAMETEVDPVPTAE